MPARTLMIVNDPPYGTERCYNGLGLANALTKADPDGQVSMFLTADAVLAAKAGHETPDDCYNLERMLRQLMAAKGEALPCGTCMDARGMTERELVPGARR